MMKKTALMTMVFFIILVAFVGGLGWAQSKAIKLSFEWTQTGVDAPDFWGWKLWGGTTSGGPYDYLKDANGNPLPLLTVQYDPNNPSGPFSGVGQITAPPNAVTTFYFVVNAWDTNGNYSPDSNEVSHTVDFSGPDAPVLSITGAIEVTVP